MKIFTTKTNYRISEITAELVKLKLENPFTRCYVFCEDKNTLSLETAIAKATGGTFNVNVTSLSRYVSSRQSGLTLSKTGSTLTVFKIINELSNELARLKTTNKSTLAKNVFQIIAQLKSAKVTPQDILEICNQESDGAFGSKLLDIYKIYDEYERRLEKDNLLDSGNFLGLMSKLVKTDCELLGAKVIFSGFSSLTKQITEIFLEVSKICDVDFVLLKGEGEFYTNEVFERVQKLFTKAEIVNDAFEYPSEIGILERALFSITKRQESAVYSDKVKVFELATPYLEVQNVAKRIRLEVVNNGRRFKDFAIAISDVKEYGRIIKEVFKEYEIPVFVDSQNTLDFHPLSKLIIDVLDAVRLNFSIASILKLSKNLLICDQEDGLIFSTYITNNAIYGKNLLSQFEVKTENDQIAENVRKHIFEVCLPFKTKASATEFALTINEVFSQRGIFKRAEQLSEVLVGYREIEIADFNDKAIQGIQQLLEEISKIVQDKQLSVNEFKNVFVVASSSSDVSVLPLFNDVVYVGDFKNVKQRLVKWLFMIGLTSDVPGSKQDTSLLNDRDLIKMEGYKLIVEPKIKVVNLRERENVGVLAMSFQEKLFMSYPRQDTKGQIVTKSSLVDFVLEAFNVNVVNIDEAKQGFCYDGSKDIYGYMSKKSALKQFALDVNAFKERRTEKILPMNSFYEASKDVFSKELQTIIGMSEMKKFSKPVVEQLSSSVIESYFSCPYSCFAKYNLKLKDEETGEAKAFEYGNLLHGVFEKVLEKFDSIHDKKECGDLAKKVFDDLISEHTYSRFLNKPKYKYMFELVKNECVKCAENIFDEFEHSSFKPSGEEVVFGNLVGTKLPAIEIDAKNGKKYISGKVDRIDRYNDYIRIVDYKTGEAEDKSKAEKLYYGNNVQLYLYANAFLDDKTKLAGVYYYKVNDKFSDSEDKQVYFGNTLLNDDVIESMDSRIKTENQSKAFKIKYTINKQNERGISTKAGLISEKHLNSFVKYAKLISTTGANEMAEGNIVTSPCASNGTSSCDYCKFGGLCGYDGEVDDLLRRTTSVTCEKIDEAVEKKDD